jgi:hypothetical protein
VWVVQMAVAVEKHWANLPPDGPSAP